MIIKIGSEFSVLYTRLLVLFFLCTWLLVLFIFTIQQHNARLPVLIPGYHADLYILIIGGV